MTDRVNLTGEHRASLRALTRQQADFLVGLGVAPVLLVAYQMVGVARVRVAGGLWVPDEAGPRPS